MNPETPFREATVPMNTYKEMENKKNNEIEGLNKKLSKLNQECDSFRDRIQKLEEENTDLHRGESYEKFKFFMITAIVVAGCVYGFSRAMRSCERRDPNGEIGIVNAERSLRRHVTHSGNQITSLSCVVQREGNNCSGSDFSRFCEVSYRKENGQTETAMYCCDNAYPEYNDGCRNARIISQASNR